MLWALGVWIIENSYHKLIGKIDILPFRGPRFSGLRSILAVSAGTKNPGENMTKVEKWEQNDYIPQKCEIVQWTFQKFKF